MMKKSFIVIISVICAVVICSSMLISANQSPAVPADCANQSVKNDTEANLLSMLNHNYVYGSDFDDAENLVNRSVNALSSFKNDEGGYIRASVITDFVSNMYGVDIVDISSLNTEHPQKQGYVFVTSGGLRKYNHSNIALKNNEDGTITATTDVAVLDNGDAKLYTAVTLFAPNENSAFGYNIIYSEISAPDQTDM